MARASLASPFPSLGNADVYPTFPRRRGFLSVIVIPLRALLPEAKADRSLQELPGGLVAPGEQGGIRRAKRLMHRAGRSASAASPSSTGASAALASRRARHCALHPQGPLRARRGVYRCRRRSKRCRNAPTPKVRIKITSNVSMLMPTAPAPCCIFETSQQEIRPAM
jgi:hypothetical protein